MSAPSPDTLPADLADLVACCRELPLPRLVEALRVGRPRPSLPLSSVPRLGA
jgi:hypothetical protein